MASDPHIQAAVEALDDLLDRDGNEGTLHVSNDEQLALVAVRAWLASVGMMSSEFERKWTVDELGQVFDAWAEAIRAVEQAP